MMCKQFLLCAMALFGGDAFAFSSPKVGLQKISLTSLSMAVKGDKDEEFMRWAKQARSAEDTDNVVELIRPLGVVLNQDPYGNVYVETVAPKGNAARSGKVKEGDIVTMCSATFGNEMWNCRGVGLSRVLAAIRVRSGPVRLALETPDQYKKKVDLTLKQLQAREEAAIAAQKKKDSLLLELESDEKKLKKGKFLGLF